MPDQNSPQILAILASPALTQQMDELLNGTGLRLMFAASSEDGLQKAEQVIPGAVLLDLDPALDPYETCRRLRANRLLTSVPVVMLCQREDRDARAAGLSAGADDFLEKPFDGIELIARLRTITRLNTYRLLLADLTRFSWMVEHAQEGYLMLDQAGAIHYANERATELLNLSKDYFGLPFTGVVEGMYIPEPADTWAHWLSEPESCFLVQPESPTARANWIMLEALDTPLGVEYHRIVRLRDVTERMAVFQDMRRFHTVIAHKLRTPMAILYSNLSIIKNKLEMLSPEEIKSFAETAIGGADRLVNQVRRILTYIDAPLALNIGEAVSLEKLPDLVESTSKSLELENVSLFLPERLRSSVLALTPDALEMILFELLENSHKFHPARKPSVDISVGSTEEGYIHIRFTDDGMTLSTEQLRWAWLPYFQGEKDFTGELPGLGLGFPMVATLLWKVGGDLSLRNRPDGSGVVVELKIPLESTARQMERSAAQFGTA